MCEVGGEGKKEHIWMDSSRVRTVKKRAGRQTREDRIMNGGYG